ncbi:MAG: carbohydrate ABC transporter permease [Lachnospiraceae bacterium]|nr:carbohydrate ABC transporter permease [Lachnospiraceae bacterium]
MSNSNLQLTVEGREKGNVGNIIQKVIIYVLCTFLAILSILPFWMMFVNATRSTPQIQQTAVSFLPSTHLFDNIKILSSKNMFKPLVGFLNSFIVSAGATVLAVYFSSLTAYAQVVYEWKLRNAFFSFIMAIMMLPGQLTLIGFLQMCYKLHLTNNLLMLILPAIAAPSMVFFMRQYLQPALPIEIVHSARIDGAREFYIFNKIVIPIMKPAIATQAIFSFVASWNNLFTPMVLISSTKRYTMPMMVSLLRADIYKTEYGSIYAGLTLTILPLIIVYLLLSKYIVAGVALGSVKG